MAGAIVLCFALASLAAQQGRGAALEVLPLRPNFYLLAGAGGNVGVQVGSDGVIVIDTGAAEKADDVVAAIKTITPRPIRYVINTSADADHVGGNAVVAKAGQTLFPQTGFIGVGVPAGFVTGEASILSAEPVLLRMSSKSGEPERFPTGALPSETFNQPRKYMYFNDEGIEIYHMPAAHTDGDSIVFFRRSDVVVAGDVLDITRFPVIDVARGGSVDGEIAALQKLVDLAIPSVPLTSRDAGTVIVAGHGRICNQIDAADYRDMVTIVRDRVRDLIKEGMTLQQIKATSPARGFMRRYGTDRSWTADHFVEAVYRSLQGKTQ